MSENFIIHVREEATAVNENRVALSPKHVKVLRERYPNLSIQIESGAGVNCSWYDTDYANSGATIVLPDKARNASITLAVKGVGPGQHYGRYDIRFHHGANCNIEGGLEAVKSGAGLITLDQDMVLPESEFSSQRPVLVAMSEFTGKLSVRWLEELRPRKFKTAKAVIFGGGVLGRAAFDEFLRRGIPENQLFVGDINDAVLRTYPRSCGFRTDNREQFVSALSKAYFAVGAVLIPGKKSPCVLTTNDWIDIPERGAVAIDPANDQGGCFEGAQWRVKNSMYTTFDKPFGTWTSNRYISVVPNMPSAGKAESSELFGNAVVKMLPFMFNVERDWSLNLECVKPALLADQGDVFDQAFAQRLAA